MQGFSLRRRRLAVLAACLLLCTTACGAPSVPSTTTLATATIAPTTSAGAVASTPTAVTPTAAFIATPRQA